MKRLTYSWCLYCSMTESQPKYSAFREASFGHATFGIKNKTHAYWYAVQADSMWFCNRYWHPVDNSTSSESWFKLFFKKLHLHHFHVFVICAVREAFAKRITCLFNFITWQVAYQITRWWSYRLSWHTNQIQVMRELWRYG